MNYENKKSNLPISSVIRYKDSDYLVTGINVKYLGMEKEKEYTCILYDRDNPLKFTKKF